MNEQPNTPDMIAQAGELLSMLQHGRMIADWGIEDLAIINQADSAIVIASAVLAVAGELRELRNVLADGLLSQLAELDADNANLIARCRHYEQIEVPE